MSEQFEVIKRPSRIRTAHADTSALSLAVAASAETGEAVQIQPNGTDTHSLRTRLSSFCRTRDLKLRMLKQPDGSYIAWAEKRAEQEGA